HRGSNVTVILEEKIEGKNRTAKKVKSGVPSIKEAEVTEVKEDKKIPAGIKNTGKIETSKAGIVNKTASGKVMKKVFQRKSV
ncbi:MAG TPA: hypothetical protein DHV33_02945, partial [Candidatus Moranbacteria bacterium]|nr:hypothetical protein [Candidatus Moranbacteria bacterium]